MFWDTESKRDGVLYITPLEADFMMCEPKYWPSYWILRPLPDTEDPEKAAEHERRWRQKHFEKTGRRVEDVAITDSGTEDVEPIKDRRVFNSGRPFKYPNEGRPQRPEKPKGYKTMTADERAPYDEAYRIYKNQLRSWYGKVNPEVNERRKEAQRNYYRTRLAGSEAYKERQRKYKLTAHCYTKEARHAYYIKCRETWTDEYKQMLSDRENKRQIENRINCTDRYFLSLPQEKQEKLRARREVFYGKYYGTKYGRKC